MIAFKYIFFSVLVLIVSLIATVAVPLDILVTGGGVSSSPYTEQIKTLRNKRFMSEKESQYFLSLIQKNNQFFADESKKLLESTDTTGYAEKLWQRKSSRLAPVILFIWGVIFFGVFSHYRYKKFYVILLFPAVLSFTPLLSVYILIGISLISLIVYIVVEMRNAEFNS